MTNGDVLIMGFRQLIILLVLFCAWLSDCQAQAGDYLSPTALVATDKTLFIACATANRVVSLDLSNRALSSIALPLPASGLALSADGGTLFATCAAPVSQVCLVDLKQRKIKGSIAAGHSARAPVLSADGKTLYVCNQFDNDVSVIDLSGMVAGGRRKEGGRTARGAMTRNHSPVLEAGYPRTPDVVRYNGDERGSTPHVVRYKQGGGGRTPAQSARWQHSG